MSIVMSGYGGDIGSIFIKYAEKDKISISNFRNHTGNISRLIHMAGYSDSDPSLVADANIMYMMEKVLNNPAREIKEIIFTSTASVYGRQNKENLREEDTADFMTVYGASKLIAEEILRKYSIPCLALRCPTILGSKPNKGFFSKLLFRVLASEDITLTNSNKKYNFYISAENLYNFIMNVKLTQDFDVINVAADNDLSIYEICDYIRSRIGSESIIECSDTVQDFMSLSCEKAETKYGFIQEKGEEALNSWIKLLKELGGIK